MTEETQNNLAGTDAALSQTGITLQQITEAEDVRQAFDTIADNPEEVTRLLQSAEDDVARTGAAMEVGFKTKNKQHRYQASFDRYASFVSLVAEDKLTSLMAQGVQEGDAKSATVDVLKDSKIRILTQDLNYRLRDSSLERSKERLGRTKASRVLGKVAVTGASVGLAYMGVKGMEIGLADLGVEEHTESVLTALGVLASSRVIKNGLEMLGDRARDQIDEYKPLKKAAKRAVRGQASGKPFSAVDYAELDEHVADFEEKLFVVAGRNMLAAGVTPKELVRKMVEKVAESFDTFYGLKKEEVKEEIEATSVVLGSFMSAYVGGEDISEELETVVHDVREVLPRSRKQKRMAKRKAANA